MGLCAWSAGGEKGREAPRFSSLSSKAGSEPSVSRRLCRFRAAAAAGSSPLLRAPGAAAICGCICALAIGERSGFGRRRLVHGARRHRDAQHVDVGET